MKIERVHVKHKTWHTRVTVGEGDEVKTFGLQQLDGEQHRVFSPFGRSDKFEDFESKEAALEFCQK